MGTNFAPLVANLFLVCYEKKCSISKIIETSSRATFCFYSPVYVVTQAGLSPILSETVGTDFSKEGSY